MKAEGSCSLVTWFLHTIRFAGIATLGGFVLPQSVLAADPPHDLHGVAGNANFSRQNNHGDLVVSGDVAGRRLLEYWKSDAASGDLVHLSTTALRAAGGTHDEYAEAFNDEGDVLVKILRKLPGGTSAQVINHLLWRTARGSVEPVVITLPTAWHSMFMNPRGDLARRVPPVPSQ